MVEVDGHTVCWGGDRGGIAFEFGEGSDKSYSLVRADMPSVQFDSAILKGAASAR